MNRFNILLITPDMGHAEILANPLRISGHEVCITYGTSSLVTICNATSQQGLLEFDLVIADVEERDEETLSDLFKSGVMRALLFVKNNASVLDPYKITRNKGVVFRYWALLAAVRQIVKNCKEQESTTSGYAENF